MGNETRSRFRVYQLDMWRDVDGGWSENARFELGELSICVPEGEEIDDKRIIQAMKEFEFQDITGRTYTALLTTDRRRIYAEDLYGVGTWWEVGQKKGRHPVFGLQFLGECVDFGEDGAM